jgi:hypothetical protein
MPAISYIKKKVGQKYLVWLQNSNQYIQLEEPAWFVFNRITKRFSTGTIANECVMRYGTSPDESLAFVKEIRSQIAKANTSTKSTSGNFGVSDELNNHKFIPFSVHNYKLGNRAVTFSFETPLFELYLHPLIAHFETEDNSADRPIFELFARQGQVVFRYNGIVKGIWTKDETHLVKGLIFMFLINVMHGKRDTDWLMTVHASAITNWKKTILFSAEAGKGKTTIAALLQTRGFQLISDDFVPIDRESFCAYPFPIAMSVKEGSMDLLAPKFPSLKEKPLNYLSAEKSVRYLSFNDVDTTKAIFPVNEFILIEYNNTIDFQMEKIDPINGLKLLFDESWISPTPGNAAILFDRIPHLSFYKLTYSNNQKAVDALTTLFNHE